MRDFRDPQRRPPLAQELARLRHEAERLRIALIALLAVLAVILSVVATNS